MIDQKYLKECLHYNSETGVFTWRERPEKHLKNEHGYKTWNARFPWTEAGYVTANCRVHYRRIGIDGALYQAHRLAWLYVYGQFPEDQIDHIDGDGLNNRIINLRDVSNRENALNQKKRKNNTSGCTGVSWNRREARWHANIGIDGKQKHLGAYRDLEDAIAARKAAEIEFGYHENHGKGRTQ